MDKSFDDILKNKIQQSFELHQEPFEPEDWKKMKEKLAKEKKQKFLWLPHFAKAASIILLVGITALIFYKLGRNDFDKTIVNAKKINLEINKPKHYKLTNNTEKTDSSNYFKDDAVQDTNIQNNNFYENNEQIVKNNEQIIEDNKQVIENNDQIIENKEQIANENNNNLDEIVIYTKKNRKFGLPT